jgi:hypothetical protein
MQYCQTCGSVRDFLAIFRLTKKGSISTTRIECELRCLQHRQHVLSGYTDLTIYEFFQLWEHPFGVKFVIPAGNKLYMLSNYNGGHFEITVVPGTTIGSRAFNLMCDQIVSGEGYESHGDRNILPGPEWLEITGVHRR